jgi:hypothetical protein
VKWRREEKRKIKEDRIKKMKFTLNDNLREEGVNDISLIGNDLVILANITNKKNERVEKRFEVRIRKNSTQEDVINSLEEKLDKPLGRLLCECLIRLVCKPENWNKIIEKVESIEDKNDKQSDKKKIPIRKFSANGTMPVHESVVIGTTSKFVTMNNNKEIEFKTQIETETEILIPNDTIYTQNPIPYIFKSEEEFKEYFEYTKKLDLDSIFALVETEYRKYVDVEGYYYTQLVVDTIWSWFQDVFPYTHYIIIIGDNDAGKNSALLLYRFLGYRVFYITSASAPNYFTVLGNREEGQVTIAEDEAEDIAYDKDKRNVFKAGYCSGASIPKIETDGGRKQDNWLVYCHKWVAMEELPYGKNVKGIIDRSFVLKFVTGSPQYNIKEVIRTGKDPEYQPLYDKLMEIRKILFCYRLQHREDQYLNVKLNIKNRAAELAKPSIRLFNNAPLTRQRILEDLSKFINERNKNKKESFEAKIYNAITKLIGERKEKIDKKIMSDDEVRILGTHIFSNESIRFACKEEMDGSDIDNKTTAFYSTDFGQVSQRQITGILKSKFKIDSPKLYRIGKQVLRCVEFKQEVLDSIGTYYDTPDEIKIIESKSVTDVTDVTVPSSVESDNSTHNNEQNRDSTIANGPKITQNTSLDTQNSENIDPSTLPESVTTVTSVTEDEDLGIM